MLAWPFTRQAALRRHHDISIELGAAYRELAAVKVAERQAKIQAFQQNQGTDRQREHVANFNGFPNTKVMWEVEGEIRGLEEERDDIRWQLSNGGCHEAREMN